MHLGKISVDKKTSQLSAPGAFWDLDALMQRLLSAWSIIPAQPHVPVAAGDIGGHILHPGTGWA